MKCFKVLLIDDESTIIEGLKLLIDWESCQCSIIGSACDGLKGLELIHRLQPDIVIADIHMPHCSGLDMIKEALEFSPCKFIILSGYSDFNYAKRCISLGIKEYLLKPVEETLLIQALEKTKEEIRQKQIQEENLLQLKNYNQQVTNLVQDIYLRDLVSSYFECREDMMSVLEEYEISLPNCTQYVCIIFEIQKHKHSRQALRAALMQHLEQRFPLSTLLFTYSNNSFMCILGLPSTETDQILFSKINGMKLLLQEEHMISLNIGIGKCYYESFQIPQSAKQAVYALSFKLIRGENSVNRFDSNLDDSYYISSIPGELWSNYRTSFHNMEYELVNQAVTKIFHYIKTMSDMPLIGIQINALNLILICLQQLNQVDRVESYGTIYEPDCFHSISRMTDSDEISSFTRETISDLLKNARNTLQKKQLGIIPKIEQYLSEHIFEDLSLVAVSQLFYLSPIYLSQLFKKETGQLYSEYVTRIRMNAAKKLILTTDLMVYEISDKLGYKDNKYFSRLFQKWEGITPSELRKQNISSGS